MKERTPMETRRYTLRFLTPAFLGGADQSGQWRTPPIKHLLRERWRVAWAAQNGPAQRPRMQAAGSYGWMSCQTLGSMRGGGIADLTIIKEFERQCRLNPTCRVWSLVAQWRS